MVTVISALAAVTAIAADMRDAWATTGSRAPELCRSSHSALAPLPDSTWSARTALPGPGVGSCTAGIRTRAQQQHRRDNATSRIRASEAPKTRTQRPPGPAPAAEVPGPTPPAASSACQLRLTPDVALAHPLPPITGSGFCGAEDVVRLEAVVLKDEQAVALAPAATLRCPMAEAVVRWIRDEVAPAATGLGGPVRTLVTSTSYDCRERDRVPGAKLSEHGRANALDLHGLIFADDTAINLTDKTVSKEFRELVRRSACSAFTTVLGPGSDDFHNSHIHVDLIERKGGYRICQWEVLTPPEMGSSLQPPS
jgi:hypothetical protein